MLHVHSVLKQSAKWFDSLGPHTRVNRGRRPYLHMPSSGSSSPNLSSKVSWILMLLGATSLQTTVVLLGYVCGKSGLWSIPSPVTVMIFSWWESCTPVGRQTQTRSLVRILFISLMPTLILTGREPLWLCHLCGGDAEGSLKYFSALRSGNQEQDTVKLGTFYLLLDWLKKTCQRSELCNTEASERRALACSGVKQRALLR